MSQLCSSTHTLLRRCTQESRLRSREKKGPHPYASSCQSHNGHSRNLSTVLLQYLWQIKYGVRICVVPVVSEPVINLAGGALVS